MKRFLARFRFAWTAAIAPDYVLDADEPGFWTVADAVTLHGFLFRSETGFKFQQIMKNYILKSAVAATEGRISNDTARAVGLVVRMIDMHFAHILKEEPDTEPAQTEAEINFAQGLGV